MFENSVINSAMQREDEISLVVFAILFALAIYTKIDQQRGRASAKTEVGPNAGDSRPDQGHR